MGAGTTLFQTESFILSKIQILFLKSFDICFAIEVYQLLDYCTVFQVEVMSILMTVKSIGFGTWSVMLLQTNTARFFLLMFAKFLSKIYTTIFEKFLKNYVTDRSFVIRESRYLSIHQKFPKEVFWLLYFWTYKVDFSCTFNALYWNSRMRFVMVIMKAKGNGYWLIEIFLLLYLELLFFTERRRLMFF